jgi:hypothetical protein
VVLVRWRQSLNEETGKYEFIPVDEAARRLETSAAVFNDITSFVSPVDGSVISDRKQLREHNKRNNVVNADEFTPEHYAAKAKERERFYNGEYTPKEQFARKQEIYDIIQRAEDHGR